MGRLWSALTITGLVASAGMVVVLAVQVQGLNGELVDAKLKYLFPRSGDIVPPFDAIALTGETVRVGEGDAASRQLIVVFNTTCPICIENAPAWLLLDSMLSDTPALSVVGWSQDEPAVTAPYVTERGFRFRIVTPDGRWIRSYKVEGVPNTLVVDDRGTVLYARPGALTRGAIDSVISAVRGD